VFLKRETEKSLGEQRRIVAYLDGLQTKVNVLKEKELKQFGEYRTRRLVLEAWDRLEGK
jgi:hypothetical protein